MIDRSAQQAIHAACMLAPCALVGVLLAMGTGPSAASAQPGATAPAEIPMIPQLPEHNDPGAPMPGAIASPFEAQVDPVPIESMIGLSPAPDTERGDPEFTLSSILPNHRRGIAVINGIPCAVDQRPAPGWTLTRLLGSERAAVLTHDSGRRVTVRMERPLD